MIHEFYDRLLLDDKISDKNAVLLSLYMCSNKNKKSEIEYGEVCSCLWEEKKTISK